MPIPLHDAFIPSARQILGSTTALLDQARRYCEEKGVSEEVLLGVRLIADMAPLSFQLKQVAVHTAGAINAVREGRFAPDFAPIALSLEAHAELLHGADGVLASITTDEAEQWIDGRVVVELGATKLPFVARDYLLSLAQPNFYFHASCAYALLRQQGLEIGKRDFMGSIRITPDA
ncbi:DUF1993 family protein [Novosphingobium aquimarinum]|uniref:DUF1993 family protein n=1 Tax=Novosphingobium aquimarinum TaxID=2682494 RepID=UPI0012EBE28A|nr:DUF1993 family protein [Novosphingobium aquimarinum]